MKWTKEPPTKPGWYWVRIDGEIETVRVGQNPDRSFFVYINGSEYVRSLQDFDSWAGPVEAPRSPEGER